MTTAATIPTLAQARARVARLSAAEVDNTMEPARLSLDALRRGVATLDHHCIAHTAIAIAEAVEEQGVVTGLAHYWEAADKALATIWARAMATGAWRAPTLRGPEIAAVTEAIELHAWQIAQLSAGELQRAAKLVIARQQSAKRPVERRTLVSLREPGAGA